MTRIPQYVGGFEIRGMLGHGGMGVVYRALDNSLHRELAIKLQSGNWKNNPVRLQRFLREARILAKINHPNVVQIYSVGEHEGAPFFAMELLEGSVADATDRKPLPIPQLTRWILEAARGLAAIHEMGVVHRDIKPGNLLLTKASSLEVEHVKVADFGIASAGEEFGDALTRGGAVLGTSGYLPPESFRAEHTLDGRADQYSLGVVFFELLAGQSPYVDMSDAALIEAILTPRMPPNVRDFRPEVDATIAEILHRMLQDDPDGRFPTMADLVKALVQVVDTRPAAEHSLAAVASATPVTRLSRPVDIPRPDPPQVAWRFPVKLAAGTFAALSLVLMSVYLWQSRPLTTVPDRQEVAPASGDVSPPAVTPIGPAVDSLKSEAWAKYVLARYYLQTVDREKKWTLDLLDQRSGVIEAELDGLEDEPIELSGRVESHRVRTVDGEDLETYRLKFQGPADIELSVDFVFSDVDSTGSGKLMYYGDALRFKVLSSVDL